MLQKKYSFLLTLISAILIIASQSVNAQTGTIKGFVYEKNSGEPVIFTKVILTKTKYGATTDVDGYFTITRLPAGDYTLKITYLGYDTLIIPISIKADEMVTKKLYLTKSSIKLKDLIISADKQEAKTEVRTSVTKITPKEIKQIPSVGGEADLAQYLQVIPGVISTGDQGGQLYIRGGSPIQNKVLLDGMIIYNPFHSIGLFSVFDADIIRNADVYTGGFGAKFGGRISSIMDITTRDGNKNRIAGKIAASPFGTKLLLEGPIKKAKEEGGSTSSYLLSAKNSYLEQTSKVIYNYVDTAGLPYNFLDLYGKVSFNSQNGSKLNLFGFNFNDHVDYPGVSNLNWKSSGGGTNFIVVPSASQVLIKGNFSYSKYAIELLEQDNKPRKSEIDGFNLGIDFVYFKGQNEIDYGIEVLGFKTSYEFYNSVNRHLTQEENTTEMAGFFKYKITAGKLLLEPSFRLHYYAALTYLSPEPRLGMKYNVADRFRLKFATGIYSQNLMSASSDRDVVNLFYGFLSGPDNLQEKFIEEDGTVRELKHNLQKANHFILGAEYDLTSRISINVEGYYKMFTQLTNLNRNKIFDDDGANSNRPDELKKDFIVETGSAKGIDFSLKYDYKKLYIWAVYSLGSVNRYDGVQNYMPHFDRRHNVNLVVSYTFGKGLNWELDGRWNYGSGFPFTKTQGFYEKVNFADGLNTNYTTSNGDLGILYSDLNGGRLPSYHRLDVNLKRKFALSDRALLEANVGATNAYNHQNVFYINRVTNQTKYQLPLLPSAGLILNF